MHRLTFANLIEKASLLIGIYIASLFDVYIYIYIYIYITGHQTKELRASCDLAMRHFPD